MKTVKYYHARQNLRTVIDECVSNNEPVIIQSKSCEVIMVSKSYYDDMSKSIEPGTHQLAVDAINKIALTFGVDVDICEEV